MVEVVRRTLGRFKPCGSDGFSPTLLEDCENLLIPKIVSLFWKMCWFDAIREFDQQNLVGQSDSPSASMTRTQLRKLKKEAFLHAIQVYLRRYGKSHRGYHQFAKNAIEQMVAYEVADDLDCYKAVIRLFPVHRMVVTSFLQAESGHFVRQQDTMLSLLVQMNQNHVLADDEVGQMIIDIFGWRSHAMQHYRHMMYWLPKLANADPWPVQWKILDDLDEDPLRLTRLITERICPDRNTEMHVVQLTNVDHTPGQPRSLISAQSPEQRALLSYTVNGCRSSSEGVKKLPVIYLDGPFFVWYQRLQAAYYTLWTDIEQNRIVHAAKRTVFRELIMDHIDLLDLPVFSHANPQIEAPKIPVPLLDSPTNSQVPQLCSDNELQMTPVDMNSAALQNPTSRVPRCQVEYDNRWQKLRESHTYKFIPTELTVHEQGEGTILAVGVVTPIADSIVNQKSVYEGMVASELNLNNDSSLNIQDCPPVPAPAPLALIRAWIKTLQAQNACLSEATIVIRVSSPVRRSFTLDTTKEDWQDTQGESVRAQSVTVNG